MLIDKEIATEIAKIALVLRAVSSDRAPNHDIFIGEFYICSTGSMSHVDARIAIADSLFQGGFRHTMDGKSAQRAWVKSIA